MNWQVFHRLAAPRASQFTQIVPLALESPVHSIQARNSGLACEPPLGSRIYPDGANPILSHGRGESTVRPNSTLQKPIYMRIATTLPALARSAGLLRRSTWASCLPKAIVIGAQKCGTTALAYYLSQHPSWAFPREKEIDFFGSPDRFGRGLEWYVEQWPESLRRRPILCEASPWYLRAPRAPADMYATLPDAKLIVVLRDPIERAYSAWQMYRRQLAENPDFYRQWNVRCYGLSTAASFVERRAEELEDFQLAIMREAEYLQQGRSMEWSVLEYGLYGQHLLQYLKYYRRDQFLILESSELKTRRVDVLNRVLAFMGQPEWDWTAADLSAQFVGGEYGRIPEEARRFLESYYAPSNRILTLIAEFVPSWLAQPANMGHGRRRQGA